MAKKGTRLASLTVNNGSVVVYYHKGTTMKLPTGVTINKKKSKNGKFIEWDYKRQTLSADVEDFTSRHAILQKAIKQANDILEENAVNGIFLTGEELEQIITKHRTNKQVVRSAFVIDLYTQFHDWNNNINTSSKSVIAGGYNNSVQAEQSSIVGGQKSVIKSRHSFVGGGLYHQVNADCSSVVGGSSNAINGAYSGIVGGKNNNANGAMSFIGGGAANASAGNYSGVMAGYTNQANGSYSSILGGYSNVINAGYASISGGRNNQVSGNYSAILGGNNNDDGGNSYTGIFGTGIVATAIPSGTGAFWTNELVIPNIPIGTIVGGVPTAPPLYPVGSLWYIVDPVTGACPIFVR